mgnify:CR=1 FL=1
MQSTAVMPARADPAAAAARLEPVPARSAARSTEPTPRERPNQDVTAPATLEAAVARAAEQHFPGREIEVHSSLDKDTGRIVHKVTDRATGEVIAQSPPEELLRFFASGRAGQARPWVRIET